MLHNLAAILPWVFAAIVATALWGCFYTIKHNRYPWE